MSDEPRDVRNYLGSVTDDKCQMLTWLNLSANHLVSTFVRVNGFDTIKVEKFGCNQVSW